MTDAEEFIMSSYEVIKELSCTNISQVVLVKNHYNQQLYIQRILPGDHRLVYQALKECHFSGFPVIHEIIYDGKTVVFEEYIEGCTLAEFAQNEISPDDFSSYMTTLLYILDHLHQHHIIHRDIKEENILIDSDKNLVLIDFAISKIETDNADISENTLGTVIMAAPEQFGLAPTDCRSDLYSFGRVCQNLLKYCFKLPSSQKNMWESIADRCTEFYPENRYQSAREILEIIEQPALFHGSKKDILIMFPHMETPFCMKLREAEEKTVTNLLGFNSITVLENKGQLHLQLNKENTSYNEVIFPAIKDSFINHHTITEVFLLENSLLIVRAFFISPSQSFDEYNKRIDFYQARIVSFTSIPDVQLSEIFENLTGYTVLGTAELLLDRDTLVSYPLC